MRTYDAVVVGAGHNGLVAALYLARAGWTTLVLERNATIGGAVRSGEVTLPGFVHDLYSTNQNQFRGSPVAQELGPELERHGLRYRVTAAPFSNAFPDGTSLRIYQDQERTRALLERHNRRDAAGWDRLYAQFRTFRRTLLPLLGTPLPSLAAARALARAARTVGVGELLGLGQLVASSTRELADTYLASPEAKVLVAAWGLHVDFGPDVSGGALFPFVETFADMEAGMAIAEGGASRVVEALAGLLRAYGGAVRTEAEVRRILTDGDRASGVVLASGERIGARRVVVANVTPTVLFDQLLADRPLPRALRAKVDGYVYGPGTMMVHLALKGKLRWAAGPELDEFAYVHIAPYVSDLARTYTDALNGLIPTSPFLVVGQTSAVDPTRAPGDAQVLWVQVRALPSHIGGDAAGEIAARTWGEAKEPVADRVVDKLETYAPGLKDLILARAVFSPADLERDNPNLVGGDSIAGSHHLRQNFLFRPFPGWSRYRMPVAGLYMVGAATWPGAGNNATSGYLAAREILGGQRARKWAIGGGAVAGAVAAATVVATRQADAWHEGKTDGDR